MLKAGACIQFACVAAAPLVLWMSAPSAVVLALDLKEGDSFRLISHLTAADARIVQVTPEGGRLIARGAPVAMAVALLRAGALPLPFAGEANVCSQDSGKPA